VSPPIGCDRKALVARGNELDRPVEPLGSERDQRGAGRHGSFRAERTAHIGAHHVNSIGIDAEPMSHAVLESIDELARLIDGQLIAGPRAGRGKQLHRIVMLRRGGVFGLHQHVGTGKRRLGITLARKILVPRRDLGGILFL
jgi:hypothetical protein